MTVFNNIQVLRAIAALMVVIVHITNAPQVLGPDVHGLYGVDLFFVISGFVMMVSTMNRSLTPWQFMEKRLIRIVPLYWAATLGVFLIALLAPALVKATRPDLVELAMSLLFIAFEKSNGQVKPVLFQGWILNFEMLFYVLFAAAMVLKRPWARFGAVTAFLMVLIAAGRLFTGGPVFQFYTGLITLEFVFGMLAGLIVAHLPQGPAWRPFALAVVVVGLYLVFHGAYASFEERGIFIGIPAFFVILAAAWLERMGWAVRSPFLLLLGATSYALYLSHPFVVIAMEKLAAASGVGPAIGPVALFALLVMAAQVVAWLIHRFYEQPADRLIKRRIGGAALRRDPAQVPPGEPASETA